MTMVVRENFWHDVALTNAGFCGMMTFARSEQRPSNRRDVPSKRKKGGCA